MYIFKKKQGVATNKGLWKFMKPFLTNKEFSESNDMTLKRKE